MAPKSKKHRNLYFEMKTRKSKEISVRKIQTRSIRLGENFHLTATLNNDIVMDLREKIKNCVVKVKRIQTHLSSKHNLGKQRVSNRNENIEVVGKNAKQNVTQHDLAQRLLRSKKIYPVKENENIVLRSKKIYPVREFAVNSEHKTKSIENANSHNVALPAERQLRNKKSIMKQPANSLKRLATANNKRIQLHKSKSISSEMAEPSVSNSYKINTSSPLKINTKETIKTLKSLGLKHTKSITSDDCKQPSALEKNKLPTLNSRVKPLSGHNKSLRSIANNLNLIEQILNEDEVLIRNSETMSNVLENVKVIEQNKNIAKDLRRNINTSPKQNISNNTEQIERILNETEDNHAISSPKHKVIFRCKTQNIATKDIKGNVPKVRKNSNTTKEINKSKLQEDSIYEFFSQSQNLDNSSLKSDDPAGDIIKRLIKEGKVSVATKRKGAGKPVIKRIQNKKKVSRKKTPRNVRVNDQNQPNFKSNDKNVGLLSEIPYEDFNESKELENNQNGAFSQLARTVLLHEAKKQYTNEAFKVQEQRRLLDAARKLISTPIRKSNINPMSTTINLSPVQLSSFGTYQPPPGNSSPWRVNETHLPSAFNFSCNSSKLPSFSSEYITATPRKKIPKHNNTPITTTVETAIKEQTILSPESLPSSNVDKLRPEGNNISFDKNDSNEENIAPTTSFSDNIFPKPSYFSNSLKKRTPLKALNILEVINLPPWKNMQENRSTMVSNSNQIENSKESCAGSSQSENSLDNLFGFTELIDDSEHSDKVEENDVEQSTVDSQNISNLKSKLHSLKKWRPNDVDLPRSKKSHLTNIFEKQKSKQRCINEMLCSTMIDAVKSKKVEKVQNKASNNPKTNFEEEPLFNDVQVESSFADKKPSRTYARPVKKRKVRHNFIMYPTSDASDDDEQDDNENNVEKNHKRPRKEDNNVQQLNTFINDFNNMCDEVEQYNIMIEKSA